MRLQKSKMLYDCARKRRAVFSAVFKPSPDHAPFDDTVKYKLEKSITHDFCKQ